MTLVAKMKNHIEKRAKAEITTVAFDNDRIFETLGILQEECAEVIQNVSKCRRFGLENKYLNGEGTQRENLEKEIGDVLAMVDILMDQGVLSGAALDKAIENKKQKLRKWSKIYE
jgi:NTP pyrophosphatase (non-canonical NTP hydrolase)